MDAAGMRTMPALVEERWAEECADAVPGVCRLFAALFGMRRFNVRRGKDETFKSWGSS